MNRPSLRLLALVAACLVGGLSAFEPALASAPPGPAPGLLTSPVIYPPQRLPLRFDHSKHLDRGLTCTYCHTGAATSRSAGDRLLPSPDRCDACHGSDHSNPTHVSPGTGAFAACDSCHEGARTEDGNGVPRVVLPAAHLEFDHRAHYDRGVECDKCHGQVPTRALATREDLPAMPLCMSCHGDTAGGPFAAPGDCEVCHLAAAGARIRTQFVEGSLRPPAWMRGAEHGLDWLERHKLVAGTDSAFCASCHDESECADCHDGKVRPRQIHPNDWLDLHAVTARQDQASCTSCHRAQSFCVTCHERASVTAWGSAGAQGERGRFHPPKAVWSDLPRTSRHHAREAERNLVACVSCHTERDCALCHATAARGGLGGLSPHPPGFAADCGTAFAKNPRPCLYCHSEGDGRVRRCR